MLDLIRGHVQRSIDTKEKLLVENLEDIEKASALITEAYRNQHKLLCCGNGGSAGDAQHIATEFIIRYTASHKRPSLPALSLAVDPSAVTATANDFGFENLFARQIEGLGQKGDVLLAITTSGNSPNIIRALETASEKEMQSIVLTGGTGGTIFEKHKDLVDASVCVPTQETARIQECHIMIGQIFCAVVENELYGFSS